MEDDQRYHTSLLERWSFDLPKRAIFDGELSCEDGVKLKYTQIVSGSNFGVVITPGISVPRESYYRLVSNLSDINVLVYDLRGQSSSEGEPDSDKFAHDANFIGGEFKKEWNLDFLIGIGHSLGGFALLRASLEENHPYDLRTKKVSSYRIVAFG